MFVRTNAQTRPIEEVFIREGVPYRLVGGTRFYERAEVKDAFAYLTQVVNPDDDLALRRIVNVPKRGIGDATVAAMQASADRLGVPLREVLREPDALGLGPRVTAALRELNLLLDEGARLAGVGAEAAAARPPHEVLEHLLTHSGYRESLRASKDPQDEARAENLDELVSQAKEFRNQNPDAILVDYLTSVQLYAAADELDDSDADEAGASRAGKVTIMTLHTAKGLEYDTVFITGVEESLLPHRISVNEPGGLAEERRLFYVGITRAKRRLFFSLATSRASFGDVSVAMPSRFLQEIPLGLIDWRESRAGGGYGSGGFGAGGRALGARGSGEAAASRIRSSRPRGRRPSGRAPSPRSATTATSSSSPATASGTPTSATARSPSSTRTAPARSPRSTSPPAAASASS